MAHKIERVFASGFVDGHETDRGIVHLPGHRGLLPLLEIGSRVNYLARSRENRDHQFALLLDRRHRRRPCQAVAHRQTGPQMPSVLGVKSSLVVPHRVFQIGSFRQ